MSVGVAAGLPADLSRRSRRRRRKARRRQACCWREVAGPNAEIRQKHVRQKNAADRRTGRNRQPSGAATDHSRRLPAFALRASARQRNTTGRAEGLAEAGSRHADIRTALSPLCAFLRPTSGVRGLSNQGNLAAKRRKNRRAIEICRAPTRLRSTSFHLRPRGFGGTSRRGYSTRRAEPKAWRRLVAATHTSGSMPDPFAVPFEGLAK